MQLLCDAEGVQLNAPTPKRLVRRKGGLGAGTQRLLGGDSAHMNAPMFGILSRLLALEGVQLNAPTAEILPRCVAIEDVRLHACVSSWRVGGWVSFVSGHG
jgi:hypothetical protein